MGVRVAVTGASGFIGLNLCRVLAQGGFETVALVRDEKRGAELRPFVSDIVVGEMGDKRIYPRLLKDVDGVFNLAGALAKFGMYEARFWEANVSNLKKLLKAASKSGVKKFTHCSTTSVMGNITNPPAGEDWPYADDDIYDKTKHYGELAALASNGVKGMKVAVVRPSVVYGPHDTRRLEFFKRAADGSLAIFGDGRTLTHPVFVDDLAEGMILAHQNPASGGRIYIIAGGEYTTVETWAATISRKAGGKGVFRHIPRVPAWAYMRVCETVFSMFQLEPPMYRRKLNFFLRNRAYSIQRAEKELHYTPKVSLEEGVGRTLEWYRNNGKI